MKKLKKVGQLPSYAILLTADVGGLYPSISHDSGLTAMYEKLEESEVKEIPSADLVDIVEFISKNNYFEFDSKGTNF